MSFDPRVTPARRDLAAAHLEGKVAAARYVKGQRMTVAAPVLDLIASPGRDEPLASQLLMGETFVAYESDPETGLAWGQVATDGYVGYVSQAGLEAEEQLPTMQVTALATLLYPEPQMKTRPIEALPQLSVLITDGTAGGFIAIHGGGYCPAQHLGTLEPFATDHVAVALQYLGVPYLWGGRSAFGLDCSALVQLSLAACGIDAPRDSDMQAAELGTPFEDAPKPGDLLFWKGHVGIVGPGETLVHANATHMAVVCEPLNTAIARIQKTDGPITGRRRL